jgi:hypothetical protein
MRASSTEFAPSAAPRVSGMSCASIRPKAGLFQVADVKNIPLLTAVVFRPELC